AYQQIIDLKDLHSDLTFPGLLPVDAYLLIQRMAQEQDPARMEQWIAAFGKERAAYDERQQFWEGKLAQQVDRPLREAVVVNPHRPAVEFFRVAEADFIPAARAGNHARMRQLAEGPLARSYDESSRAIDEAVRLTDARYDAEAAGARRLLAERRAV